MRAARIHGWGQAPSSRTSPVPVAGDGRGPGAGRGRGGLAPRRDGRRRRLRHQADAAVHRRGRGLRCGRESATSSPAPGSSCAAAASGWCVTAPGPSSCGPKDKTLTELPDGAVARGRRDRSGSRPRRPTRRSYDVGRLGAWLARRVLGRRRARRRRRCGGCGRLDGHPARAASRCHGDGPRGRPGPGRSASPTARRSSSPATTRPLADSRPTRPATPAGRHARRRRPAGAARAGSDPVGVPCRSATSRATTCRLGLSNWLLDDVALLPVNMIRREREARALLPELAAMLAAGDLDPRLRDLRHGRPRAGARAPARRSRAGSRRGPAVVGSVVDAAQDTARDQAVQHAAERLRHADSVHRPCDSVGDLIGDDLAAAYAVQRLVTELQVIGGARRRGGARPGGSTLTHGGPSVAAGTLVDTMVVRDEEQRHGP